jgi:hypothetical protein
VAHTEGAAQVPLVPVSNPPYALTATPFRFPALATLAGRAPLGGQREVALAAYLAARLAQDVLPERGVPQPSRVERAAGARSWLAMLALPASVRPAVAKLVDASAGDARGVADTVRGVTTATASFLDARSRAELERLAASLESA